MMKLVCRCGWKGTEDALLRAPHPFPLSPGEEITGCPECNDPCELREACDEPDCWVETCCGTPTPSGYRRTCSKHLPRGEPDPRAADPRNTGPDHEE